MLQHCHSIEKWLVTKNLNINNCIAIGTDNACVILGFNNGVYAKLKQENHSLILMRCVCHTIQLAMPIAYAECLSRNWVHIIAEALNWHAKSSVRQYQYNEHHNVIKDGTKSSTISSDRKSRWMFIQPAVENMVAGIKSSFKMVGLNNECYSAELLFKMYSDKKTRIFTFFNLSLQMSRKLVCC